MRSKITVVGAGFVGSTLVQRLAERDYADVVMFDIVPNMPQGKALDMLQAGPVLGYDSLVVGTNDYADTANSDIVVVTSGFPRKPGMTRDDLVKKNQEIVTQVTEQVVKHSPNCIMIMVTNPLDAMVQLAYQGQRLSTQPGGWYGRGAGYGAFPHVYRSRTERLGARCAGLRAGWPWRYDGAAARMCTVAGVPISQLIPPRAY